MSQRSWPLQENSLRRPPSRMFAPLAAATLGTAATGAAQNPAATPQTVLLRTTRLLDGLGKTLTNVDLVCRVQQASEAPMHALKSATSLNAEALGLGGTIATIAAGYEADTIAMDGDPIKDITAVRRVTFMMEGGVVVRGP